MIAQSVVLFALAASARLAPTSSASGKGKGWRSPSSPPAFGPTATA